MLTELSVTNFKCWREVPRMRLAPITGLFGANSSGKSSILQLLLMLKQTVESADRAQALIFGDERTLTNLGSFASVIHGRTLPGSMRLSLSWQAPEKIEITASEEEPERILLSEDNISFEAEIEGDKDGHTQVVKMLYTLADQCFGMKREGVAGRKYGLSASGPVKLERRQGRPFVSLPGPFKCYGFPHRALAGYYNADVLSDLQLAFEELFGRVYYLGPLRAWPAREYPWAHAEPGVMGVRGERVVEALLSAREEGRMVSPGWHRTRVPLDEYVAKRLKDLGLIHDFRVDKIADRLYQVHVQKAPGGPKVELPDVGFGVSQVLPAMVLCYYVPEGSTVILEQPEIHLHPSVQAGLADVFIEAALTRHVQVIFESHSEYLLKRLQRRMAEGKLKPTDAALYFCQLIDGTSTLTPLELGLYGQIANWPKDFFGDEFSEVVEASLAALKRQEDQAR